MNTDIDSKNQFFHKIKNYYVEKSDGKCPVVVIDKISEVLSGYFYAQYKEFRKSYPKSIKRYSKFNTDDLENPLTHDFLIRFLSNEYPDEHVEYCSCILGMTHDEYKKYENRRKGFEDMF